MTGSLIGPRAQEELRRIARKVLMEEVGSLVSRGGHGKRDFRDTYVVQTSTAGVSAFSGATPGTGNVTVYYRTTAGSLSQYSTNTIVLNNLSTDSVPGSAYVTAVQDNFGAFFTPAAVTTTGSTGGHTLPPVYASADAVLLPGSTTAVVFSKKSWNGTSWAATTVNVNVKDPGETACYLQGEEGWLNTPDGSTYFPAGEHGLRRLFQSTAGINVGSSASAKFIVNGSATTANGTVTVGNDFPGRYNRAVISGENDIFWGTYEKTSSRWQVEPAPIAIWATGDASTHVDPNDSGAGKSDIGSFATQDWVTDGSAATTTLGAASWGNTYDIATRSGNNVLMYRSVDNAVSPWRLFQAGMTSIVPHTDLQVSTAAGQLQAKTRGHYVGTYLATSTWTNTIATTPCT